MQIHSSISDFQRSRPAMGRVAFVPTMGNLHAGHIHLMREAQKHAETVVASIFVNRLQFGPGEDFERYPRTFEADCAKLSEAGVGHLLAPDERAMYPTPQRYYVSPDPVLDQTLDGASRPGHFQGVCTVVAKLLHIVQPQVLLLGKKDYQQVRVLTGMVEDLAWPIEICPVETLRAQDGLAFSSRNGYLSESERQKAPQLHAELVQIAKSVQQGRHDFGALEYAAQQHLEAQGWVPDYVAIRRRSDLQTPQPGDALVVLGAAKLGTTRLIDNLEI